MNIEGMTMREIWAAYSEDVARLGQEEADKKWVIEVEGLRLPDDVRQRLEEMVNGKKS